MPKVFVSYSHDSEEHKLVDLDDAILPECSACPERIYYSRPYHR
jgi:hypothetical protein